MKKTLFYFALLVLTSFVSCSNNEIINSIDRTDIDTNFVEKREAIALATMLKFDVYDKITETRSTSYLEVDSTVALGDTDKPSYYLVNYKENAGFVIIAADKRAEPILAFSTEGGFDLTEELPGGLVEWLSSTDKYIKSIRESNIQKVELRGTRLCYALKSVSLSTALAPRDECFEYNGSNCPPELQKSETVGPLLKTTWGQGAGYNDLCPGSDCKNTGNGKYPAGCVAISTAQVMKYHKYPKGYNWDNMADNYGTTDAAY